MVLEFLLDREVDETGLNPPASSPLQTPCEQCGGCTGLVQLLAQPVAPPECGPRSVNRAATVGITLFTVTYLNDEYAEEWPAPRCSPTKPPPTRGPTPTAPASPLSGTAPSKSTP